MQEDIDGFGAALVGMHLNTTLMHRKNEYPRRNDTELTERGRARLAKALQREYELLAVLERVAVNGRSR